MSLNEDMIALLKNINYLTKEKYVTGRIVEYDIKSSNITLLRKYNMISEEYYTFLASLPKKDREIEVGNLKRIDRKYYDVEREGIYQAMLKLVELNQIPIQSIVRKANDALFINTPIDLQYTDIDGVLFSQKGIYDSLLVLDKIIFLFYYDINGNISVDVKGINEEALDLHNGYILTSIGTTIFLLERASIEESLKYISGIIDDYLNRKLDINYYRNFDNMSKFQYKYQNFCSDTPCSFDFLNTDRNLFILRELYGIIFSIYARNK